MAGVANAAKAVVLQEPKRRSAWRGRQRNSGGRAGRELWHEGKAGKNELHGVGCGSQSSKKLETTFERGRPPRQSSRISDRLIWQLKDGTASHDLKGQESHLLQWMIGENLNSAQLAPADLVPGAAQTGTQGQQQVGEKNIKRSGRWQRR